MIRTQPKWKYFHNSRRFPVQFFQTVRSSLDKCLPLYLERASPYKINTKPHSFTNTGLYPDLSFVSRGFHQRLLEWNIYAWSCRAGLLTVDASNEQWENTCFISIIRVQTVVNNNVRNIRSSLEFYLICSHFFIVF